MSKSQQQQFIETLIPYAEADYLKTGVLPSITISQAILESNWGKSGLTKNYNNAFGIKADKSWTGKKVNMGSNEWNPATGKMVMQDSYFRVYDNLGQSVRDHSDFFWKNGRYADFLQSMKSGNYKEAVLELGKTGYATDPDYSVKLRSIIETYDLDKVDKGEKPSDMVWIENRNNNAGDISDSREELEDIEENGGGFVDRLKNGLNPMTGIAETMNNFVEETLPNAGFILAGIVVGVIGLIFLFNESGTGVE